MHDFLCSNIKKTNRTLTLNVLMKLLDNKCGTTPVMEMSKSLSRNCVQKSFQEKIVVRIMQEKVNDARIALHIASKEFECSKQNTTNV